MDSTEKIFKELFKTLALQGKELEVCVNALGFEVDCQKFHYCRDCWQNIIDKMS